MAQHTRPGHAPDPVPLDVRLEVAQLLRQLRADVSLDRVPRPDLDQAVYEAVDEGLGVLDARLRAVTAARDERGKRKRERPARVRRLLFALVSGTE
ncbi:MAG TPA: hypothetical protein VGJ40_00250 [Gaiellaceae bacterium]